jgi:[ribosomal protein S5]-alanine N-acetyltransferase
MELPTIHTQRLTIRHLVPSDLQAVYSYVSDPQVMTYIPEGVFSESATQEFVTTNSGDQATAFAVVHTADQQLIGHILFHNWFAPQTFELGWILHPAYQRQGYTTEAAAALMQYGFETLKLHRIIATCQPENAASYRVMEKLGMRREGWFQKCIYRGDGVWWSEFFYAMLEEEWFGMRNVGRTNETRWLTP